MFAEVFKEITGHRVRVCTLEGPVNGVVERVSDNAVVLRPDAGFDEAACRQRLRASLSAYKVPRHFFVCEKAELPFTDSGKIDKRRLATLLEERTRDA